jgi:beta-glucosidase
MAKKSNKRFRTLMVPLASLLVALPVIVSVTANDYSASLDFSMGKGEKHIEGVSGIDADDLKFYDRNYDSSEASRLAARDVAQEVEEQGAVLLKNESSALPIAKKSSITPFGYRYVSPYYGGTGSANISSDDDYVITPEEAFSDHFNVNSTVVNAMKAATPVTMEDPDGNDPTNLSEYAISTFNGTESSCHNTTGIVFIARPGTEGYDINSTVAYSDGTATQQELTTYEKAILSFAKTNCDNVIVLVISPSPMMINDLKNDNQIQSIIWAGLPGAAGYEALCKIMDGETNPSGKTSDIWYADFKSDPTYANHLTSTYSNAVKGGPECFMEYEEGIYMGYRYYETRYSADNEFNVFGETKGYDDAVMYPFGFGLNYGDDKVTQSLDKVTYKDGTITVQGSVTNASSMAVDEVVQVYYGAPYTEGGIEKSSKNLINFDKVNVPANGNESFTVTFNDEDMASYDYKGIFADGGSYVLESGDYSIYLGKDSHDSWAQKTVSVPDTLVYSKSAKSGKAVGKRLSDEQVATDLFNDLNGNSVTNAMTTMSRSSFSSTFPTSSTSKAMSDSQIAALTSFDYKTDPTLGEVEGSKIYHSEDPVSKQNNGLTLSDLRGLDHDDAAWDDLLNQLDYDSDDIDNVLTYALYQTSKVESIGKVETNDNDGTVGLTANWGGNEALATMFGSKTSKVTSCCYPCAPIQAATWSREVMKKMGESIGEESLTNKINGWYAPGLNLHRTPYGGRNFEYYSEDPVLSGEISAVTVSGAFSQGGLYAYLKHFALNETDVDRSSVSVWANEQACRELYFKGFEICAKKATGTLKYYDSESKKQVTKTVKACRGVMASMNYIGMVSPINSYNLLTELLRNEWGFVGMVETDFTSGTYKSKDVGYRIGNDLWMAVKSYSLDLSTPTAKWAARNAIHNICYVIVNSNAYDQVAPGAYVYYEMSPWRKGLIAFDCVIGVLALGSIAWIVLRQIDDKKHPGKYEADQ